MKYSVKLTLTFYNKFGESLSYETITNKINDDVITFINKIQDEGMRVAPSFKEKYLDNIIKHIYV